MFISSMREKLLYTPNQAKRLAALEEEMTVVNAEYTRAVNRASEPFRNLQRVLAHPFVEDLHAQVKDVLFMMLSESDADVLADNPG
jgi:mediator of RNA polymerase II transcription subunit 21